MVHGKRPLIQAEPRCLVVATPACGQLPIVQDAEKPLADHQKFPDEETVPKKPPHRLSFAVYPLAQSPGLAKADTGRRVVESGFLLVQRRRRGGKLQESRLRDWELQRTNMSWGSWRR